MFGMIRSVRVLIFGLAIGGAFIKGGLDDLILRRGTSEKPVEVKLEQLEAGTLPDNAYWHIGPHVAMTNVGVYQFSRPRNSRAEPTDATKVGYYYYPILSTQHPYLAQAAARRKASILAGRGSNPALPPLDHFTVLVKTRRFETVGALPTRASDEAGIQGMAINRVTRLDDKERRELAALFPHLDVNRLLIFEEGRAPATASGSYAQIAIGATVCLGGLLWVFSGARRREETDDVPIASSRPARTFA